MAADSRTDDLLARWSALMGSTPAAQEVGRDLVERYGAPGRHYHDLTHLTEVLDAVDLLAEHAVRIDEVRLAAWFHDAVYDPRRTDNEEASARLADERLTDERLAETGVDAERSTEVVRLIRLTARHDPATDDTDGAVLCDADLAILAAGPERYGEYAAGVRAEYAHVEDAAFLQGRIAVLEALLAHDPLYRTPTARNRWERRARHNVATELTLLGSGAP